MIRDTLLELIKKRSTILGVGPMSLNCVDVVIDLANKYDVHLSIYVIFHHPTPLHYQILFQ